MSLFSKMEADVEVKANANKVYELFKFRPYQIINIPTSNIHSYEVLEGEWGSNGCVVLWTYSYGGETRVDKELIEDIDDENRSITLRMMEGHLLELYKSFKIKLCIVATPKKGNGDGDDDDDDDDEERCVVRVNMEYEKKHEGVADPTGKLQFVLDLYKEIGSHIYA